MSDEHTPTTEEVREAYATHRFNAYAKYREVGLPEFDRWLAAYDKEVRADERREAIRDAYANINETHTPTGYLSKQFVLDGIAAARGDGAE